MCAWAAGARAACAPHAARELPKPLAAAPPAAMDDEMEMEGAEYGGEEPQLEEVRARARVRSRARAGGGGWHCGEGGARGAVAMLWLVLPPPVAILAPFPIACRGHGRSARAGARTPVRARVSAAHSALSERARLLTGGACLAHA